MNGVKTPGPLLRFELFGQSKLGWLQSVICAGEVSGRDGAIGETVLVYRKAPWRAASSIRAYRFPILCLTSTGHLLLPGSRYNFSATSGRPSLLLMEIRPL